MKGASGKRSEARQWEEVELISRPSDIDGGDYWRFECSCGKEFEIHKDLIKGSNQGGGMVQVKINVWDCDQDHCAYAVQRRINHVGNIQPGMEKVPMGKIPGGWRKNLVRRYPGVRGRPQANPGDKLVKFKLALRSDEWIGVERLQVGVREVIEKVVESGGFLVPPGKGDREIRQVGVAFRVLEKARGMAEGYGLSMTQFVRLVLTGQIPHPDKVSA